MHAALSCMRTAVMEMEMESGLRASSGGNMMNAATTTSSSAIISAMANIIAHRSLRRIIYWTAPRMRTVSLPGARPSAHAHCVTATRPPISINSTRITRKQFPLIVACQTELSETELIFTMAQFWQLVKIFMQCTIQWDKIQIRKETVAYYQ